MCSEDHAHNKKKMNCIKLNAYSSTFFCSVREKEENMKTVEGLLEKGLIEVANKEEELKVCV